LMATSPCFAIWWIILPALTCLIVDEFFFHNTCCVVLVSTYHVGSLVTCDANAKRFNLWTLFVTMFDCFLLEDSVAICVLQSLI
jgi:hypothetical protein